jgi:alanine dehydrogenase
VETTKESIRILAVKAAILPQEEMLEVGTRNESLRIGIPKEVALKERRVALDPDAVGLLVAHGHRVVVETDAGVHAHFTDTDYSESGAEIALDSQTVFACDVILKVAPPQSEELEQMRDRQTIFSGLQLSTQPKETIELMIAKKITAVAWDFMRDKTGVFPLVRAMGEIAGTTAISIAAGYLAHHKYGNGTMLGGLSGVAPSQVVIIGAGTVGEYAARAAKGLGAEVRIFDASPYRLRRLQSEMGRRLWTSTLNPKALQQMLAQADVVIGAVRPHHGRTPCIVTETMVEGMKEGSVIVDVSIDSGGCFETSRVTSHESPIYVEHGVTHYGVPNIPSRVPRTASQALSNGLGPLMLSVGESGGIAGAIHKSPMIRSGLYLYNGCLVNADLAEAYDWPYRDLNLLLAGISRPPAS